jgi:DNA-binding response OmpR family regulator
MTEKTRQTTDRRVLLGEDDAEMRSVLAEALRDAGYTVVESADGMNLLTRLSSLLLSPEVASRDPEHFDLIISDIRMPGVTGLSILEGVQLFDGFPPMILITAFGDEETHVEARRLGVAAFFDKPFDVDELLAKVKELAPLA